jgi:DNA-binding MarR family transcriptional regulator
MHGVDIYACAYIYYSIDGQKGLRKWKNICMRTQKAPPSILTEDARKSWKAFFLVGNLLIEQVETSLQAHGVGSLSEYDALYTLIQAPESGLTIRELTASLTLSHSGLSRLLDRLALRGAIERCPDPLDKRAVRVRILPKGREILDESWRAYGPIVEELYGQSLTTEEHHEMLRLCAKLSKSVIERKEKATRSPFLHKLEE